MVETRSGRGTSPLVIMLLPLGLLVVIAVGAWAMFANPVPGSMRAVVTPDPTPAGSATPLPEPSYTDNGSMNVSASTEEYRRAAEKLQDELPEGYRFPNELPSGADPDLIVPPGSGELEAITFWRCAWTAQFLIDFDAKDQPSIDRDLDVLDSWLKFSAVKAANKGSDQAAIWRDEIMEPARDGHIGNLRTFGLGPCKPVPTKSEPIEIEPALELEWTLTPAA